MAGIRLLPLFLIYCLVITSAERLTPHKVRNYPLEKNVHYQPNWKSIDSRPLPAWYDEAKFGIFMHWGVYSVPAFETEWFWYRWKGIKPRAEVVEFMQKNYPPRFTYPDFGPMFTAELFDADHFAKILKNSGAQYVVLTSKHHEGFTNWPSNYSWNWNAMDVGPKRDLVRELADAIRSKTDIKFGLYYSLFEWFHPLYLKDKGTNFTSVEYVKNVMMPQLHEIVNEYKPHVIWGDGAHGPDTYWNSTEFLAWLYNESPVKDYVVVNDRWADGTVCNHGGFYSCKDRYNPGILQPHKWENCMTIDKHSWGYRRDVNIADFLTMDEIIQTLAETVSCGGNMLMNFGPSHDGRIIPIFEERLLATGAWLKVNGEAIYSSKPWRAQNDTYTPGVWYTTKDSTVYAILLNWPSKNTLYLGSPVPTSSTQITMLGRKTQFEFQKGTQTGVSMIIKFPSWSISDIPCKYAWVLKMEAVH